MKKEKIFLVAASVFSCALALSFFFVPIYNHDLFWHLSAGRHIIENLSVPAKDFLSWPEGGTKWLDFEWLSQALYYSLYSFGGFGLLQVFKIFCAALLLAALGGVSFTRGLRGFFAQYALFALLIFPNADLRPENFSLLFFAVQLWFFESVSEGKTGWNTRTYAAFLAGYAFWANLHAGFVFGLLLTGLYLAGDAAGGFHSEGKIFFRRRTVRLKPYLICLLVSVLGSFANPLGVKIYGVIMSHLRDMPDLSRHIIEWGPSRLTNRFHWPYMLMVFYCAGLFLFNALKRGKIVFPHVFAVLTFALLASWHTRHIGFFAVASSFIITAYFKGVDFLSRENAARQAVLTLLVFLFFFAYVRPFAFKKLLMPVYPGRGAVEFLKENKDELADLKMRNPWKWGGYLGFYLYPDYKVFVDGRYIFHKYLAEILIAGTSPVLFGKFAERWGFGLALAERNFKIRPAKTKTPFGPREILRPEYLFFFPPEKWALVWWNASSLIFVRRGAAAEDWLREREYSAFMPDDIGRMKIFWEGSPDFARRLEREVNRYEREHSASPLDLKYSRYVRGSVLGK